MVTESHGLQVALLSHQNIWTAVIYHRLFSEILFMGVMNISDQYGELFSRGRDASKFWRIARQVLWPCVLLDQVVAVIQLTALK